MSTTTMTMTKVPAKMIRVERAEGLIEECYADWCETFEEANDLLSVWATTAPESGYDKCDFTIVYEDGNTYSGRFDLQRHHSTEDNLLETHLQETLDWSRGMTDEPFFAEGARANVAHAERYALSD